TLNLVKSVAISKGIPIKDDNGNIVLKSIYRQPLVNDSKWRINDINLDDFYRTYPPSENNDDILLYSKGGIVLLYNKYKDYGRVIYRNNTPITSCTISRDSVLYLCQNDGIKIIDLKEHNYK